MDAVALEQLPEPARCFVDRLQQTIGSLQQNLSSLQQENTLLRQKIDALIKKYFGGQKTEAIDPKQLELLLAGLAQAIVSGPTPGAAAASSARPATERKKAVRQPLPAHLPVERVVLEPAEVKDQPQAWKQIGQEITEELDWKPAQFFKRLYIRPKYVRRQEPDSSSAHLVSEVIQSLYPASEAAVVIAPLPSRLIEKGLPGAGLLAQVIISKYEDHLPLYRQEKIYAQRHGVKLSRATLAEWVEQSAQWLRPVYEAMKQSLLRGNYLQADETPIRYLDPDLPGKSHLGYLWTYSRPGAEVIFDWQTSRGQEGPAAVLKSFGGLLQTDGYNVYESLARERTDWTLLGCWAHGRRKFVEALGEDWRASWVVRQLGHLYGLEKRLRQVRAGPALRCAMRASEAVPVLRRVHTMLTQWQGRVLPQSLMGKAITYALERWEPLNGYVQHGIAEIDNNLVENAIRPTAVGKKNFLFIGHPEAGWRSAVIYSVLGSCRRAGINPHQYLRDILGRLPEMKMSQIESITPAAWAKTRKAATRKRN